jgi:hypothetical protein
VQSSSGAKRFQSGFFHYYICTSLSPISNPLPRPSRSPPARVCLRVCARAPIYICVTAFMFTFICVCFHLCSLALVLFVSMYRSLVYALLLRPTQPAAYPSLTFRSGSESGGCFAGRSPSKLPCSWKRGGILPTPHLFERMHDKLHRGQVHHATNRHSS